MNPGSVLALWYIGLACLGAGLGGLCVAFQIGGAVQSASAFLVGCLASCWFGPRYAAYCQRWEEEHP